MNRSFPVPRDPLFPRLADALDAEEMAAVIRRHLPPESVGGESALRECVPEYVRYKPGISCIIGYSLRFASGGNGGVEVQRAYGRFVSPDEGKKEYEKALKTHTATPRFGPPVLYIPDFHFILSFFPNDRCLRRLRFVLDSSKLKRIAMSNLTTMAPRPWWISGKRSCLDILSYKPERHCVVRCRLVLRNMETEELRRASVIGKMMRREMGGFIFEINQRIREAYRQQGEFPIVPEPFAFDQKVNFFFQEEMSGWHPLPDSTPADQWHDALSRIGASLRSFHGLKIKGLRSYPLEDELADFHTEVLDAVNVLPDGERRMANLLAELEKDAPGLEGESARPVHGDFHARQILINGQGPVLLDLDAIRLSDPLVDVANFTAHLSLYRLEGSLGEEEVPEAEAAFLKGYLGENERDCRKIDYLWYKKMALGKLALSSLKYLSPKWPDRMRFFLDEAEKIKW